MQRVKCNSVNNGIAAPSTTGATYACWDGYTNPSSSTGDCVGTCGLAEYGSASFNARSSVTYSTCNTCSSNCYECSGSGSNQCLTCKAGYYLSA
jgi:hypothetical protein